MYISYDVILYIYTLDSRFGAHIRDLREATSRPRRHQKMLVSAERSPLSDGSGSTTRRLRADRATPRMSQICGLWIGSLVGTEPAFKLAIFRSETIADRKFPEFLEISSRILLRIFEDFSCFVSWETETRTIHEKSPPFFNAKFPGKHEKNIHKLFLESGQSNNFLVNFFCSFILLKTPNFMLFWCNFPSMILKFGAHFCQVF